MKRIVATTSLVFMVLLCVPLGLAQTTQGQLNGRIADTSGAVIPGAQIEITNTATGIKIETEANEAGQYVMYLPFGTYDLRVTSEGFDVNITTGILVTTAPETTVNVDLQVEAVAEEVTVSAAIAQLETTDTTVSAAIEENLLRDAPIPVSGGKRRPYQYIELSPGVNNTNGRGNIAGSRTLNTVILLDGLSTEVSNHQVGSVSVGPGGRQGARNTEPSVEAIGEYKLLLSNTSAEYGRSSGGMITYATKSGTNEYHGSIWNYHNNSVLNARNWQAASRGNSHNNEFGVAAGSPVILPGLYKGRNKTFFWSTLSYYRQSATGAATNFLTLPTAAMRNGDFSHPDLSPIFDRQDQFTDGEGQVRLRPFVGNIIPMSRQSRVTGNVMALLPLPNARDTPEFNHLGSVASTFKPWDFTTRVDHHFNVT